MLHNPHLIPPRVLRCKVLPVTTTNVPRLWPNLPPQVRNQLASQMAQLLCRMRSHPPSLPEEGCHADGKCGK